MQTAGIIAAIRNRVNVLKKTELLKLFCKKPERTRPILISNILSIEIMVQV